MQETIAAFLKKRKHTAAVGLVTAAIAGAVIALGGTPLAALPSIPLQDWADTLITFLNDNFEGLFVVIAGVISGLLDPLLAFFTGVPELAVIVLLTGLAYVAGKWRLALFVALALLFISSIGFFAQTMATVSLALTATIFALFVGIPLGVLKAQFRAFELVLDPVLDFMQTMPLFVYLIPAVLFFGIGNIPGIVATFIFAMPPAVRLTALGIEQIPKELSEAGHAFGATRLQFLTKIEMPLALPSIMAGVNQTIMLSLSMVVVASMIGAEGLGQEVLRGITRLNVGQGIAAGIGIVLLAMILDRLTKSAVRSNR